jgi:hypothetical protein
VNLLLTPLDPKPYNAVDLYEIQNAFLTQSWFDRGHEIRG